MIFVLMTFNLPVGEFSDQVHIFNMPIGQWFYDSIGILVVSTITAHTSIYAASHDTVFDSWRSTFGTDVSTERAMFTFAFTAITHIGISWWSWRHTWVIIHCLTIEKVGISLLLLSIIIYGSLAFLLHRWCHVGDGKQELAFALLLFLFLLASTVIDVTTISSIALITEVIAD